MFVELEHGSYINVNMLTTIVQLDEDEKYDNWKYKAYFTKGNIEYVLLTEIDLKNILNGHKFILYEKDLKYDDKEAIKEVFEKKY